jgi:hypothetical protein
MYALLEGLSKYLSIDRKELSGCLHWYRNPLAGGLGNFDFILFDNTPGGAGYVRNLRDVSTLTGMLREGMKVVSECDCGDEVADTACYSCLCNYYNQKQHNILQRRYAIEFFTSIKNGMQMWDGVKLSSSSENHSKNEGFQTVFNGDGQNQTSMSYNDIWEYISQDTNDEVERALFAELSLSDAFNGKEKPYYGGSIKILESGKSISVDLIWPRSKVAFFLKENSMEYDLSKQTDWINFCMKKSFQLMSCYIL